MAAQYTVVTAPGFLQTEAALLETYPGAVVSTVLAYGTPANLRRLAAQLNGEAPADPPADPA